MINPTRHKQLFLDDSAIESTSGLTRQLHHPQDEIVIRPDLDAGQISVQSRSAPQWNSEKELWEWWYWGYFRVPPHGPHQSTEARLNCYATSTDGVHWQTPALGLYEWQGSRQNNIAYDPDAPTLYHILRDEREPNPQRRYKALFDLRDRYLGVSPDGFTWTMLGTPAIPSGDESHLLYDPNTKHFLAFVKQHTQWGRSVWLASSRDFNSFTVPQLVFETDERDREIRKQRIQAVSSDPAYLSPPLIDDTDYIAEVYQMAVMPYAGLYIGFPVIFNPAGAIAPPHRNYTALNQVELTVSHDLLHWDRVADRALFLPVDVADDEHYGWAQKLLCGTPHIHEDREIWLYYNALRFRGPQYLYDNQGVSAHYHEDASALVLGKLRLDGFVSLNATTAGTLITKPFAVDGGNLFINVEASEGEILAELLDAAMEPIAGYTLAECNPIRGDHLRATVSWQNQTELPPTGRVRIRFHLQQAKLYAFGITPYAS